MKFNDVVTAHRFDRLIYFCFCAGNARETVKEEIFSKKLSPDVDARSDAASPLASLSEQEYRVRFRSFFFASNSSSGKDSEELLMLASLEENILKDFLC